MKSRIIASILTGGVCFAGLTYLSIEFPIAKELMAETAIAIITIKLAFWAGNVKW